MKMILQIFSMLGFAALFSACSINGNITDLTVRSTIVTDSQVTGLVSGGKVQITSGGYQVFSTVGDPISAVVSSSSGGYTIYSNVTGNYISSSTTQIIQ